MAEQPEQFFTSSGRQISREIAQELQEHWLRISPVVSAQRLWNRTLTEEDRRRLGGNFEESYTRLRTVGMWRQLRGVSLERAVIEVAREIGFLDDRTANWLLREIGEEEPAPVIPRQPVWDPARGELRLGGQVVRHVRVMAQPSNIQRILDAFQGRGWPSRIDDPLPDGPDQQRLHQVVLSLNEGLSGIRFHVQEGGRAVTWELR